MNARTEENPNLMVSKEDKSYKNVVNMLRSLGPLNFTVAMNSETDGKGFTFKAFDIIDEDATVMNPIFEIFFFCPINVTKKVLNFTDSHTNAEEVSDETDE